MSIDPKYIAEAEEFLRDARRAVGNANERYMRDNLTSRIRLMFPKMTRWIDHLIKGAENKLTIPNRSQKSKKGFVDNLINATAIEFESNLSVSQKWKTGYLQVQEYCSGLLNAGFPASQIRGVLSDTIKWHFYQINIAKLPKNKKCNWEDLALLEIESEDFSQKRSGDGERFIRMLERFCGRIGDRELTGQNLADDLGFESEFSTLHLPKIEEVVEKAFVVNKQYGKFIADLWNRCVGYLNLKNNAQRFDLPAYIAEFYLTTLAKLICANVLEKRALISEKEDLINILNGQWFKDKKNLLNLVEYDYFGWLNRAPHINAVLPIAHEMQVDLAPYDYTQVYQEDLFGRLMAELAQKTQRELLGQEWTPKWLARKIVHEAIKRLPEHTDPCFIDMCCGSGSLLVEIVTVMNDRLNHSSEPIQDKVNRLYSAAVGFDIDPVAVMLAKVSWVIAARHYIQSLQNPLSIPVYHADSLHVVSPLGSQTIDSRENFVMELQGSRIELPTLLLLPQNQQLFDQLVDYSYQCGMESSYNPKLLDIQVSEKLDQILTEYHVIMKDTERSVTIKGICDLIVNLDQLNKKGQNGLWAFVIRNSYRPHLLRGKFNGLVSNPPWMALSKFGNNPFSDGIKSLADKYHLKPSGSSFPHLELSTLFLTDAVERYLKPDAIVACILPRPVLNGYQHDQFRKEQYRLDKDQKALHVDSIWEIAQGTFKNRAIVVYGTKVATQKTRTTYKGLIVSETNDDPINFSISQLGKKIIWSSNPIGSKTSTGMAMEVTQGADIMPRRLFLVDTHLIRKGVVEISHVSENHTTFGFAARDSKEFKSFKPVTRAISDDLVFRVITSKILTQFHLKIDQSAWVLLPITIKNDCWTEIDMDTISKRGKQDSYAFQDILKTMRASSKNKFNNRSIWECINERGKIEQQRIPRNGYMVFMGAGGGIACASYLPCNNLNPDKMIIDQTLYFGHVDTEEEALYVVGLLNSSAMIKRLEGQLPEGEFGARHLHERPFQVMLPYDPSDPDHHAVVDATKTLISELNSSGSRIVELRNPNKSTLARQRSEVRKIIVGLPSYQNYEQICDAVLP